MAGIFWMTAILALAAIGLVTHVVPPAPPPHPGPAVPFREVLFDSRLVRLNFGIFTLHLVQMAMFVVVPGLLVASGDLPVAQHWKVYLPAVLVSFALMVPAIIYAERRGRLKGVFVAAILLLLLTETGFALGGGSFWAIAAALLSFFVAFNILEAMLPSLISRVAHPRAKGAALGVYNTTQALGLFLGGALGGWLAKHHGAEAVFVGAAFLVAVWLWIALTMPPVAARPAAAKATPAHGILDVKS
jgi:predicted MFS family arabinose efflux permease